MKTATTNTSRDVAFAVSQVITGLRHLSPDMPMQQADILLQITLTPGLTMAEISKRTGLSQAAVTRNIQALSQYHRLGKPGLNLVEAVIDPRETRRRIIFLTTNGKFFMTKLLRVLDENYSIDKETDARVEIERMHEAAMASSSEEQKAKRGKINRD